MAVALYPGAFKPPHKGHFEVVKRLLNGSHEGKVYDISNYKDVGIDTLREVDRVVDPIRKVVVFIGGGDRSGISPTEAKAVWDIYSKYLPGLEVVLGDKNPMKAANEYAKSNPEEQFYAVTGIRSEDDFGDLRRITIFKNRTNVEGLIISGAKDSIRATDFRKSLLSGNLDTVLDFFPQEVDRKEILKIMNMLKKSIISEVMKDKVDDLFEAWFKEDLKEGSSGTPIAPRSAIRSDDRQKLITLYNRVKNQVESDGVQVSFHQDHIRVGLSNKQDSRNFDFTPYMASILEYMIDEGMNIQPLPEVKIRRQVAESVDFFGRTAYYDPNVKEVVLYVEGRHPKDVMRSFTHEMVHHIQNIEGRMGNIQTSDTNESDTLLELEKEAYLVGNVTFRNWEDKTKNGYGIT
tara:strand:- start:154 stop:1368 length:1215 start_codon:yes stop_codon:yes gene_type:complete